MMRQFGNIEKIVDNLTHHDTGIVPVIIRKAQPLILLV